MADEVTIQHPVFKDQFYKVPADKVGEWTDIGWIKAEPDEGVAVVGPPSGASAKEPYAEAEASPETGKAAKAGKSDKSDKT